MIGSTELIIIVIVVLLVFGAAAIPKLARSIGKARSEFDEGLNEGTNTSSTTPVASSKEIPKKTVR